MSLLKGDVVLILAFTHELFEVSRGSSASGHQLLLFELGHLFLVFDSARTAWMVEFLVEKSWKLLS